MTSLNASTADSALAQAFDPATASLRFLQSGIVPTLAVETLTDAATVTPNSTSYQMGILTTLSQTTTFANPTGSPVNGQRYTLRIKSTTARTLNWGSEYRGSSSQALPTSTTGSSKTDYIMFLYNAQDTKWDMLATNFGF